MGFRLCTSKRLSAFGQVFPSGVGITIRQDLHPSVIESEIPPRLIVIIFLDRFSDSQKAGAILCWLQVVADKAVITSDCEYAVQVFRKSRMLSKQNPPPGGSIRKFKAAPGRMGRQTLDRVSACL